MPEEPKALVTTSVATVSVKLGPVRVDVAITNHAVTFIKWLLIVGGLVGC